MGQQSVLGAFKTTRFHHECRLREHLLVHMQAAGKKEHQLKVGAVLC